jgi:hypothetical protein
VNRATAIVIPLDRPTLRSSDRRLATFESVTIVSTRMPILQDSQPPLHRNFAAAPIAQSPIPVRLTAEFGDRMLWNGACSNVRFCPISRLAITIPIRRKSAKTDIALHSITSSARASSVGVISTPIAFAVLRFMTSSNAVGACTGSSAALAPSNMRSAYCAARRNISALFTP